MALPTTQIPSIVTLAAASTTFQDLEPLLLATEAGCVVREWHELVDLDW
jgi:hypothetical protein